MEKKATMVTFGVPGMTNIGQYGRWAFVKFTEVYQIQADLRSKVEMGFHKMLSGY